MVLTLLSTTVDGIEDSVNNMKIRIVNNNSGNKFPYGHLTETERQFIRDFGGEVFTAERVDMNYYVLKNGYKVHVYNGYEINEA